MTARSAAARSQRLKPGCPRRGLRPVEPRRSNNRASSKHATLVADIESQHDSQKFFSSDPSRSISAARCNPRKAARKLPKADRRFSFDCSGLPGWIVCRLKFEHGGTSVLQTGDTPVSSGFLKFYSETFRMRESGLSSRRATHPRSGSPTESSIGVQLLPPVGSPHDRADAHAPHERQ